MTALPPRLSPRAGSGTRRALRRMARSPFAAHLRASANAAFWPAVVCSGLVVGMATGDLVVTWNGVIDLSTYGGTR